MSLSAFVPSVPALNPATIMEQVKATAKTAVTEAISQNPVTAQIAGVTDTLKGVVQKVKDAPLEIKEVVKQTMAEQGVVPAEGEYVEEEAPAEEWAEEEAPAEEWAGEEEWAGGGRRARTRRRRCRCRRAPKSRKRKTNRKSSKRRSRRRRS